MDRAVVYRQLAQMYGWGPEIVRNMTPAQMLMYLDGEGKPSTKKCKSIEEAVAFKERIARRGGTV